MKWKVLTVTGLVLWGVLLGASRVDAAEEPVVISEEVTFWAEYFGGKYEIDPTIIQSMAWHESRCDPLAQSPDKSCKGILQVKPSVHAERMEKLKAKNVFDCGQNIHVGVDYLSELLEEEDGNIEAALARYNGQNGESVEKARNGKPGKYVKKILDTAKELEK